MRISPMKINIPSSPDAGWPPNRKYVATSDNAAQRTDLSCVNCHFAQRLKKQRADKGCGKRARRNYAIQQNGRQYFHAFQLRNNRVSNANDTVLYIVETCTRSYSKVKRISCSLNSISLILRSLPKRVCLAKRNFHFAISFINSK